ncbi:glycosyltransferase [Synechococcus sp. CC9311]|uniref:glycosyltransferase n=1 Tax=Synechococcus sp. (strain CC9311) TaxID=64471 RepID=UPI00059D8C68|nr:glycosyltransferase [Synechococcus sp. CC9311]
MSGTELNNQRLLVFAPTRRALSETFIRANLEGLPFELSAYFGDEFQGKRPLALAYSFGITLSKVLTRLHLLRLAGLPASLVAWCLIQKHRPDLVLAEFGFEAVRVMEAAVWAKVPLVAHFRGSDASAHDRLGLLEGRYRRLLGVVSGVIVKSRPMAQTMERLGADPAHILISPSGANAQLFRGGNPAIAPPVLLAVGRFVAKKGPLQTVRAFGRCSEQGGTAMKTAELWMVGDGPLLVAAQALVIQLGLQNRVRFLGPKPPVAVAALMREVRAFVQHSCVAPDGDSEGSPVSVMEAQLSGLPVISTFHAGIPEVVIDQTTGLLVQEGDERAMADCMIELLLDPSRAEALGNAGRNRVLRHYTIDHHLRDVTAFLRARMPMSFVGQELIKHV